MNTSSVPIPVALSDPSRKVALILAVAGAALAALFVTTPWVLAILAALVILVLSAIENEVFLLLVIILTPVSWVLRQDLPVRDLATAARLLVVAGFFLGRLLRGRTEFRKLLRIPITWTSVLFIGACVGSVLWGTGGWTHDSARTLVRFVSYMGFYFLILSWVNSRGRLQKVLIVLLTSTILVSAFAIFQEIIGGYTSFWLALNPPDEGFVSWEGRAPSFLSYANSLAGYLNLLLPFALACCFVGTKAWKKTGGWTLLLGAIALACTQSRGGIVAFGCVIGLAIFLFVPGWPKRILFAAGLIALALSVFFLGSLLNPAHLGEIEEITAASRLLFWVTAWNFFLGSPMWGIGIGNFQALYGWEIDPLLIPSGQFGVHNLYLQFLSEAGLLGFLAFSVLLIVAIREARRQWHASPDFLGRALGFGVLGATVAMLVHGFVDFVMEASPQFGTVFWVLFALLVANGRLAGGSSPQARESACGVLRNAPTMSGAPG
jgi:O-antigen ligase